MMKEAREADLFLNSTEFSVLERQKAHLKYHNPGFDASLAGFFNGGDINGFLEDLPVIYGDTTVEYDQMLSISPDKITSAAIESGNFKKRKFDSFDTETKDRSVKKKKMNREEVEEEEEEEEKSKITEQNNETTKSIMKMKNKTKKECSTDYIHVRARRGQATDSHSIAERVRREKISEKMKYLQDLVPGCDKITGKAGMLDEIINYVQSLQRQIEFLSMKLAAVNPRLDFDIDDIFAKEVMPTPTPVMMSSHESVNSGYVHFSPMQQVVTNSDPLSCFNNGQAPSMWNMDLQNIYNSLGL